MRSFLQTIHVYVLLELSMFPRKTKRLKSGKTDLPSTIHRARVNILLLLGARTFSPATDDTLTPLKFCFSRLVMDVGYLPEN